MRESRRQGDGNFRLSLTLLPCGAKPNEKGHRITKIVVLSEDKRKVTRSEDTKASTEKPTQKAAVEKASKASAPTQPSEPFKFGFDPTKSMNK
jgi:hypothetical protein